MESNKLCEKCSATVPEKAVRCSWCEAWLTADGAPTSRNSDYSYYGVPRTIPESVKRQVRNECGFGCIYDGTLFIEYDHFDPEFIYLKHGHRAEGIALLCHSCHARRSGIHPEITTAMVASVRKNPYALRVGSPGIPQLFAPPGPKWLRMGTVLLSGQPLSIEFNEQSALRINPQDDPLGPVQIDANFETDNGAPLIQIVRNELTINPPLDFDYQILGAGVIFKVGKQVVLELDRSDNSTVNVIKANFWFLQKHIQIDQTGLYIDGNPKIAGGSVLIQSMGNFNINI